MRLRASRLAALFAAAVLLAGCGAADPDAAAPEPSAGAEAAEDTGAEPREPVAPSIADLLVEPEVNTDQQTRSAPDDPASAPVPHIYLALQPGGAGSAHSAVFAIDAGRDGTPSDDPAIRLTPEGGRCNPQEMRRYDFPPDAAPVVSEAEQAQGLTARDLPAFLAAAVTGRTIEEGLAAEPEDTRGLNICTRKLWERLVVAENRGHLASEQ